MTGRISWSWPVLAASLCLPACGADVTGATGTIDGAPTATDLSTSFSDGATPDLTGNDAAPRDLVVGADLAAPPNPSAMRAAGLLPGCNSLAQIANGPAVPIQSAVDLAKVTSGKRYVLGADLDLAGVALALGPTEAQPLRDFVFEGAGHTLSKFTHSAGLFAHASCFIIVDLRMRSSTLNAAAPDAGLVVGAGLNGYLDNVIVSDSQVNGTLGAELANTNRSVRIGGVMGYFGGGGSRDVKVENVGLKIGCSAGLYHCFVGGIVGYHNGAVSSGLGANATVTLTSTGNAGFGAVVGGAIGIETNSKIDHGSASGSVTVDIAGPSGNNRIGGFIGDGRTPLLSIQSTTNVTLTRARDGMVGGVAGTFFDKGGCVDCSYAGTVKSDIGDAGGIAGWLDARLERCAATATVSSLDPLGGTAGGLTAETAMTAVIAQSYSNSTVAGLAAGGLVGRLAGDATIEDSYALGNVGPAPMMGTTYAGGVAGYVVGNGKSTVRRSYSSATVNGKSAGGIIGAVNGMPAQFVTVSDSYFDSARLTCMTCLALGNGVQAAALAKMATFVNWDFAVVWRLGMMGGVTGGAPELRWQ